MTLIPPPALDVIRRRRERYRPVWNAGIITTAFVAAGAAAATAFLPAAPTPTNVAKAYIEARFARDWARAWELVCGHSRAAIGSYTTYAANADYWADNYFPPSDVDVSVGHLRGAQRSGGPSAAVTLSVTTDQGNRETWEVGGELSIVEEDGEFRVCDKGSNVG